MKEYSKTSEESFRFTVKRWFLGEYNTTMLDETEIY